MNRSKRKLSLAIASLTCCEGCQVELLNLNAKLLSVFEIFNLGNFSWMEEIREKSKYDITLIEGSPISKEDYRYLKELRQKSTKLIALGTCAHLGGIQEIKNYHSNDKAKIAASIYEHPSRIANPNIVPVGKVVRLDGVIPACPINRDEALRLLLTLGHGIDAYIPPHPVCLECQWRGYDCVLQQGQPCLGPVTLGGCTAICPASSIECYGCRGPIPGLDTSKFLSMLDQKVGGKRVIQTLETFGALDTFLDQAKTYTPK